MTKTPDHDTPTLAGLAAANGPWLAARLLRLADLAGLSLPAELASGAVDGASRVLTQILAAEGHPGLSAAAAQDSAEDPAVLLGREQAVAHREAGLPMPDSLRVQRLLRRAYDDLVRESWVEKDSRSRAHEDVEHFFERALIGLAETWTGQAPLESPAPAPPGAEQDRDALLARREDQLRRTLDAAKMLTRLVRQHKERADGLEAALEAGLAQAREQAAARLAALKAEFTAAHAAALTQARSRAEAEAQAQNGRISALEAERARLEDALASQDGADRRLAREELETARAEAAHGRAEVERARSEAAHFAAEAQTARAQAEAQAASAAALREELRQLKADHATLASDAEAMRLRLSETGSRLSETKRATKRAEDAGLHERLRQAEAALSLEQERYAALEAQARQTAEANAGELHALSASLDELRELLTRQAENAEAAEAEARAHLEELTAARNASVRLLATHLALTPDAVAALDSGGAFTAWNAPFLRLFSLREEQLAEGIGAVLPLLAAALTEPGPFLARLHELLDDPALGEDGLDLSTTRGRMLTFRSSSGAGENGAAGRLLSFRDEGPGLRGE